MQGIMPGADRRGRPRTAWMDNIITWTGLSVEKLIRMVNGESTSMVCPTLGSRTAKEQNKTCTQNLTILTLAIPEMSLGAPKFKVGHVTLTMPLLRVICFHKI